MSPVTHSKLSAHATAKAQPSTNPKIIHRIYFENYKPFKDNFLHYLETWKRELPDYQIMIWNASNLDVSACEWTRRAAADNQPVFLSEYFRWKLLQQYGGIYLDADCEILNGPKLHRLLEDFYGQEKYDAFCGVEEFENGFPTAQTVAAKKGSKLIDFMVSMYEDHLGGPLWHWREKRGLIGPQLMSLYFLENGIKKDMGFFPNLMTPVTAARVKIYPQEYFSPKFSINGSTLRHTENTCVYHLFANLNVDYDEALEKRSTRDQALTFNEYKEHLQALARARRNPITRLKMKIRKKMNKIKRKRAEKIQKGQS